MTPASAMPQPGCYVDSHHGHYAIVRVIDIATDLGRPLDPFATYTLSRYDEDSHLPNYPGEAVIEESDRAIEWLNEHHCPDGYSWGWYEGDFGLYAEGDDE